MEVYELREKCAIEQMEGTRCRRRLGGPLEYESTLPAAEGVPTLDLAEGECRSRMHDISTIRFREQCDGTIGEVSVSCHCEWDAEAERSHDCRARARSSCPTGRETCEVILVPQRVCRMVSVPKHVCD